jgi:hypothetical protein
MHLANLTVLVLSVAMLVVGNNRDDIYWNATDMGDYGPPKMPELACGNSGNVVANGK